MKILNLIGLMIAIFCTSVIFYLLQRISGSKIGSLLIASGIISFIVIGFNLCLEEKIPTIVMLIPIPLLIIGFICMMISYKRKRNAERML